MAAALAAMRNELCAEATRLRELQRVNDHVRNEEVEAVEAQATDAAIREDRQAYVCDRAEFDQFIFEIVLLVHFEF